MSPRVVQSEARVGTDPDHPTGGVILFAEGGQLGYLEFYTYGYDHTPPYAEKYPEEWPPIELVYPF
jgi:hypothetical protein